MAAARTKPAPAAVRRSIAAIDRLVAERMRGRRLMLGMTQLNLAQAVGVSYQQLNKYETGENRISVGKLHQIAQVLGVEMSYFFEPIEAERSPISSTEQRLLQELARHVAMLNSRQREAICMIARAMAEEHPASST